MKKIRTSLKICVNTTLEILSDRLSRQRIYIELLNTCMYKTTGSYCAKIVNNIFTSYARNVRLQRDRKRLEAGATLPVARSINSGT